MRLILPPRRLWTPQRYSNRFSSNPYPLNGLQFYVDLWNVEQQGVGTLTNGTGVATPTSLGAGANTVTVTTEGTFTIWLPDGHTGTAASGTATVTGSPVSLSGNNNTITVVGTGTITVTCTDQVVDRSVNAALGTVTGATWGIQGRSFVTDDYIELTASQLNFTSGDFSIGLWLNFASIAGTQIIIQRGSDGGAGEGWHLRLAGETLFYTQQAGAGQYSYIGANFFSINTWYEVFVTRQGASVRIFVNGVDETDFAGTHIDPLTSAKTVKIGIADDLVSNPLNGKIGMMLVYNRVLSVAEIQQIYNATKWRY